MLNSARILRHLLAPLVLIGLTALIIARNSRADAPENTRVSAPSLAAHPAG